jgi:transposase InsO family protein
LDDERSCPRVSPSKLTPREIGTIKDMVLDEQYRHIPIRALALLAQRLGKVFAAPATWGKLIRQRGWVQPRKRLYPPKPKLGIRATRPGEILHVDFSVIKLIDGSRTYLHAIIDNYSRRILAWKLMPQLDVTLTSQLVRRVGEMLPDGLDDPKLLVDGGIENFNSAMDALLDTSAIARVLAQGDISFSNSMIEALWSRLKHAWLYLHDLDSFQKLENLIAFYVQQHNLVMPHAAFDGQTPDEVFRGVGADIPTSLKAERRLARKARKEENSQLSCGDCLRLDPPTTSLPRLRQKV